MLTFEQKLNIIESYPQLQRKDVSLGRINFHYEESVFERKVVVYHLHPNGNGFVYAGHLSGYNTDDKGLVNIRDYSEAALRSLIEASIRSLSEDNKPTVEDAIVGEGKEQRWMGPDDHILLLVHEDDFWNIYAGLNLEAAFASYEEAEEYLQEEGFSRL